MQEWDFDKRKYKPYKVPEEWNVSCFEVDMEAAVNCARCGRKMVFGDGYTSHVIHTEMGMGYTVCDTCYTGERAAYRKSGGRYE